MTRFQKDVASLGVGIGVGLLMARFFITLEQRALFIKLFGVVPYDIRASEVVLDSLKSCARNVQLGHTHGLASHTSARQMAHKAAQVALKFGFANELHKSQLELVLARQ